MSRTFLVAESISLSGKPRRGRPSVGTAAVADALVGISNLAADLGDLIAELDVNPLAVTAGGCMALDALVIPSAVTQARLVIDSSTQLRVRCPGGPDGCPAKETRGL